MWDWFIGLGSLSVFLAVGALGLLFLLLSFFFSEHLEAIDPADGPEAGFDGGPSVFSLRTLSIFLTGLGGIGAIAQLRGARAAVSAPIGLLGGVVLAGIVYAFARYLYSQQSSSLVTMDEIIGQRAEVIVGIPVAGVGQVRCQVGEALVEKIARARSSDALPPGTPVRIEKLIGETLIVSLWQPLESVSDLFSTQLNDAQLAGPRQTESTDN
jgi:membrane protein implicated in regulation of membrane protease activity